MRAVFRGKDGRLTMGIEPFGVISIGYFAEYMTFGVRVCGPLKVRRDDPARQFHLRDEWRLMLAYRGPRNTIRPIFRFNRETAVLN